MDIEDPVIVEFAPRHGVNAAAVCLRRAVERGQVPIPMSTGRKNYVANIEAVCGDPLTIEEMKLIGGIGRNCGLVKGQVFLWKAGQSWEDLWDIDGEITRPLEGEQWHRQ